MKYTKKTPLEVLEQIHAYNFRHCFSEQNIDILFKNEEIIKMDKYTKSYLETALWSSTDDEGNNLDSKYSVNDFAVESIEKAKKDTTEFFEKSGALLDNYDYEIAMHDFWLTRNGHGAGFWDGDYKENDGEALTDISLSFGELNIVIGDDGKLYLE